VAKVSENGWSSNPQASAVNAPLAQTAGPQLPEETQLA